MSKGYFCPHHPYWYVNRELLVVLAGSRAIMLELAHPLVAAGVAQHSNFKRNSLGRLYRTIWMMVDASFGTDETARQAAGRVHRCHHTVNGVLRETAGMFPAGTSYHAHDPHLKMWVLATLIDSILQTHDLFIRPLSEAEQEAYYADCRRLGQLLGIPPAVMPATYADFTRYMEDMLLSQVLTVTDTAREVMQVIFAPPIGPLLRLASFAGIGLLPLRLRQEFGFQWDDHRERRLQRLAAFTRRVRPWLPTLICVWPQALLAERRLKRLEIGD